MSRLPFITNDNLDEHQRAIWDGVTGGSRGPGSQFITAEGGLAGPFNAAMHAPNSGRRVVSLGAALRFETSLEPRLLELSICTVGAHWKSNFEWFAHRPLAERAGVTVEVLDAIERGEQPEFTEADEQAVYAVTRALLVSGRVADAEYAAAHAVVGDQGMVELTQVVGFYCLISFSLNAFEVALPPGNDAPWPY